jgi:hypothetical protein
MAATVDPRSNSRQRASASGYWRPGRRSTGGRVMRFHIRDDLYLECGRIDTAQLATVGRLAAGCTLVENAFTTPLDDELLARQADKRTARLDDYSPIDTASWSPSGSTAA